MRLEVGGWRESGFATVRGLFIAGINWRQSPSAVPEDVRAFDIFYTYALPGGVCGGLHVQHGERQAGDMER